MALNIMSKRIIADLPAKEYHQMPEVSKHQLDNFHKAPALYIHKRDNWEESDKKALVFGSLFHTAILEPDLLDLEFFIRPDCDRRTKEGKAIYAEALEKAGARRMVSETEWNMVVGMRDALHNNPKAKALITEKIMFKEGSIFWTDQKTGVKCRARPDVARSDEIIVDLKTCSDAERGKFSRDAFKFNYHRQAHFYGNGMNEVQDGYKTQAFVFIAIEKTPPYLHAIYTAPAPMVAIGRQEVREDLHFFSECLAKNNWPGMPERIEEIDVPAWELLKLPK
jgi:exodeoxyribonuclease VIII